MNEKINSSLKRINSINIDPYYLFQVTEAYVFGEYLEFGTDNIRFIDVLVQLTPKEKNAKKHEKLKLEKIEAAHKRFSNHLELLLYPEQEVKDAIKKNVHNLRIHSFRDRNEWKMVEKELVFKED